ncbi:hypothetical protein GJU41_12010 [Bacillus idriensis]|uniref:Uncharacterized protein n=1 Tax=Metabacillus idriensis TaxID=324768 RepID=A0A6I2M994_9BACI|nr:hypothetical protein [Metabacillus idriensis]MRX54698.1 hypothetical protein [Metabacillus idriensis]
MLTNDDINFIKANRIEITENRTVPVVLLRTLPGDEDPYTGEFADEYVGNYAMSATMYAEETVLAVWKEYSSVANGDRSVIGGVELQQDDVQMTLDASVDMVGIERVKYLGETFEIITVDRRGIGDTNRYECVVRRVV